MRKVLVAVFCLVFVASISFGAVKKAERRFERPLLKPLPAAPAGPKTELRKAFAKKINAGASLRVRCNSETFGISRARVRIWGEVTPDVSFLIQPDFAAAATGGVAGFADVYAELRHPVCTLRFGQFLLPFAYDSSKYKVIYGGGAGPAHYNAVMSARDYGLRFTGVVPELPGFYYDLALVNGTGTAADVNKNKDVVGRINYKNNFFDIGLSGCYGKAGTAETLKKDAAVDIEYKFNPYQLVAEYVVGGSAAAAAKLQESSLQLSAAFGDYEPLIKYELYDPDVNATGDGVNTLTWGIGYLFDKNTKFIVNYNIKTEETTQAENNT
ncbi:hypothetical protein HZB08_02330, partial [Candidatus Saganbacteria bacterium]|nr:hypothetical protein [Candidatus Saganbacteria bacterium]